MRKLICLLLLVGFCASAEQYTEFYIQPTGDNKNSGSTTNDAALFTYTGTFIRSTGTFTNEGAGTPSSDTTNGAWVSIYTTAGATVATCVGQITNLSGNIIWISLKALGGAVANVSESIGAATAKVGGAWAGPNTNQNPSTTFPWAFMASTMTNDPSMMPCFNFKSAVYPYTNTVTLASTVTLPFRISGYGTTPRDGIRATNYGHFAGASFNLVNMTANNVLLTDFAFIENGSSGTSYGLQVVGGCVVRRCFFSSMYGYGLYMNGVATAEECEFVNCNLGNSAGLAGCGLGIAGAKAVNCISHNNATAKAEGFTIVAGSLHRCISYYNSGNGLRINAAGVNGNTIFVDGCAFYSNALSGMDITGLIPTQGPVIEVINSQFFRNHGMGITNTAATANPGISFVGRIANCTFGSGGMANLVGDIFSSVTNGLSLSGALSYTADGYPWVDPDNGNFSQSSSSLDKARGLSLFLQTSLSSPTNTVSYIDVGPTQASDTNATATAGGSYTFAQ